MRRQSLLKSSVVAAGGALVLGLLGPLPAQALAAENPFTADSLSTWQTNGTVWSMASARGLVFAGGNFTQVRAPGTSAGDASSKARANLVVLDAATGVPTDCTLNVTLGSSTATVRAITASPDGSTVYFGGLFSAVNGVSRGNVAAVDVSTCTVLPFNPTTSSYVHAIAATSSRVYLGGAFTTLAGQARSRLGAVTPSGTPLAWAPAAEDDILALAIDPNNGNVVLGGRMDTVNGQDSHDLAVVDGQTGTTNVHNYPKPYFPYSDGQGQRQGNSAIKVVTTDATGFYVGSEGTGSGLFDGRAAFDWGTYTQRWRDTCLGATQALAVYQGVLFNGNHMHNCQSEGLYEDGARHYLNSETTAGKKMLPWWPNTNGGIGEGLGPRAITVASSGAAHYLWYGGEFTTVNGISQQSLTRFGEGPDTGRPGTPATPNVTSTVSGQVRVMWRSSIDDDDKTLTYRLYRGSSTTPIATLTSDSVFYSKPQLAFTDTGLTPGTKYSYRVTASDGTNVSSSSATRSITVAGAANPYANRVVSDGASEYFRMEEPDGSAAANNGSSSLGGTYVNGPSRTGQAGSLPTYTGTSGLFDGTDDFLRTDQRKTAPTTYSEELWFKTTSTAGGLLMGYGDKAMINGPGSTSPNSAKYDRVVYLGKDGKLLFGTYGSSRVTLTSTAAYNDGQWHQAVTTQSSAGMVLYVDGKKVTSNTTTTAMSIDGYWRVGGDGISTSWPNSPATGFFAGNIDEAAVYPTALTAAQVADHYTLSGRTTTSTPTSTTQSVTATADSYVRSDAASTNYGTASTLSADGDPKTSSYLRFTLPSAPAGTSLTKAVLKVKTSSSTSAGSPAAYTVALSGTSWTETGLTYTNRPATTTTLGSLTATSSSTAYSSTLSSAAVQPLLGGTASLTISGTSSDGIVLMSRSQTDVAGRPQLVLTFS